MRHRRMSRISAFILLFSIAGSNAAATSDAVLREEIYEHVISACWLHGINNNEDLKNSGIPETELLQLFRMLMPEGSEDGMYDALLPMVRRVESMRGRMVVYRFGLSACIDGMLRPSK